MNDLESEIPGAIYVREGVEYEVIGYVPEGRRAAMLQRVGLRDLPIREHTRVTVIPTSNWASEWKLKTPGPVDPVAERLVAALKNVRSTSAVWRVYQNDIGSLADVLADIRTIVDEAIGEPS